MQSQVKFNRVVPGRLGAKPSQVQQGSGEGSRKGSGEGLGGFGAEPGQVQQGSGEGSGEGLGGLVQSQVRFNRVPEKVPEKAGSSGRLWCRARSGSTVPEKDWEALVQSQVRFKRLWCRAKSGSTGFRRRFRRRRQSQVRFNRVPEKAPEKVPGSLGAKPSQVQQVPGEGCREGPGKGFGNLWWRARSGSTDSTGFPALGFAARFRKICNNKTLRLLGIPPKLIWAVLFCCKEILESIPGRKRPICQQVGSSIRCS